MLRTRLSRNAPALARRFGTSDNCNSRARKYALHASRTQPIAVTCPVELYLKHKWLHCAEKASAQPPAVVAQPAGYTASQASNSGCVSTLPALDAGNGGPSKSWISPESMSSHVVRSMISMIIFSRLDWRPSASAIHAFESNFDIFCFQLSPATNPQPRRKPLMAPVIVAYFLTSLSSQQLLTCVAMPSLPHVYGDLCDPSLTTRHTISKHPLTAPIRIFAETVPAGSV